MVWCALLALSACSVSSPTSGAVGSLEAAIGLVPPSVRCVRITARGSRDVSSDFPVAPGQSALLSMQDVPVGHVVLRAFAYPNSCSGQPTWASAATPVEIEVGVVTPVALALEPAGGVDVDIGFGSDGGAVPDLAAPADLTVPPDLTTAPDFARACAAAENCFNELDDDCNGKVNDTCPVGFTTGPRRALTPIGGSGGTVSTIACPPDTYVVSIQIWGSSAAGVIAGLGINCAKPNLVHTPDRYAIINDQLSPQPFAKVMGTFTPVTYIGTEPRSNCLDGTSAATWVNAYSEPKLGAARLLVALNAQCGLILLDQAPNNRINLSTTGFGGTDRFAVNYKSSSSAQYGQGLCATDGVLVGFDVRAGAALDGVTPLCAPLVPVYRP
jgi:hypothetical protein